TCVVRIEDQSNPDDIRYQLMEKLDKLTGQRGLVKHEAGQIPAGMREAFNEAQSDRIGGCDEDNRYFAGRLLYRIQGANPVDQDRVRPRAHQVRRARTNVIEVGAAPSHVDLEVAPIRPAELLQPSPKSRQPKLALQIVAGADQDADSPRALLPVRYQRPRRRRAADERDELAPPHSITSSARASSDAGTSMPSALAICMLMTSSNLVARKIGRLAGFSPLSTRPT